VGGATIAGAALAAGLLDECHLFVVPVAVGGGLPAIQPHGLVGFELLDLRRFDNGTVHVSYRL
jgi:riboflavin biosynthesis pyrimidine reductase